MNILTNFNSTTEGVTKWTVRVGAINKFRGRRYPINRGEEANFHQGYISKYNNMVIFSDNT